MTRPTRASLSLQGRGLLAGGFTAAVCGALLAERDLVRMGLVVAALPLLSLVWLRFAGRQLDARRRIQPTTIEVGQQTTVTLEVDHAGLPLVDVLVQDTHSRALGDAEHLTLRHVGRGTSEPITYALPGVVRGVFDIGPVEFTLSDPFGLAHVQRLAGDSARLTVTPRIHRLPAARLSASWAGAGDNRPRAFAVGNAADVTVRDYRIGDDLRRIHWRSTARTGELMVRREEQPWQSRCTLLLDNRTVAHRGSRTDSTLEVAISAAGSIALHLAEAGYQVRFVSATGDEIGRGWHDGNTLVNTAVLLEALALLQRSDRPLMDPGWIDDTTSQSLFIGVFGTLTPSDQPFLSRLRRHGVTNHALAVDTTTA
ncbi:MAG: DUF58 domain-containing protein, partial [Myxococcales bacterium]